MPHVLRTLKLTGTINLPYCSLGPVRCAITCWREMHNEGDLLLNLCAVIKNPEVLYKDVVLGA